MLKRSTFLVAALVACAPSASLPPSASPAPPLTAQPATAQPVTAQPSEPATQTPASQLPTATWQTLGAETAVTTAWSARLSVPATWHIAQSPTAVLVQDPEREVTLGFVAVEIADRDAAIAEAWRRVAPGFALPVAQINDLPGRDGWDAQSRITYVTKTEDSRAVLALARRTGKTWHVATLDGKTAAFGRRGAQVGALINDMKVPGVQEESFAGKTPNLDPQHIAKFDAFVEEARRLDRIPGVAIAVVHGGKIVFEKGYGVRSLETQQKVTPQTQFLIASMTKPLTTLMLARMIDQKKFDWKTPVVNVLPSFALGDAAITPKVTVEHTVCACTGMPRQDLEWLFEYAGWDPERRLASMASMKPTTGFGETFQYSNLMVSTGGWIGAHVSAPTQKLGPAYDKAMRDLVYRPLGMTKTTYDFAKVTRGEYALPHSRALSLVFSESLVDNERAVIALRPAGGAWSSVHDIARYVMLELARGKTADGKQLVSEENLLYRRKPQVKIDADTAYGLGLFLASANGVSIVGHGGNLFGYTTNMFWFPDHDMGVVMLSNAGNANAFRSSISRGFVEAVFDGKPEARDNLKASIDLMSRGIGEELALIKPADEAWIAPLLGRYSNPDLGVIELRRDKETFLLDVGEWTSEIAKKTARDGAVKVKTIGPPFDDIEFLPKTQDGKTSLVLDAGQQVYTFTPVTP